MKHVVLWGKLYMLLKKVYIRSSFKKIPQLWLSLLHLMTLIWKLKKGDAGKLSNSNFHSNVTTCQQRPHM